MKYALLFILFLIVVLQIRSVLSHWTPEEVLNLRQDAACLDAVDGFVPSADDIRNK